MKGFVKVASAIPKVKVADCRHNVVEINRLIQEAAMSEVQIIVFPELSITGYTCGDLFFSRRFRKMLYWECWRLQNVLHIWI